MTQRVAEESFRMEKYIFTERQILFSDLRDNIQADFILVTTYPLRVCVESACTWSYLLLW